jgi:hypothetical protein
MTERKVVKQLWCSSLVFVFALAMAAGSAGAASTLDALWHMDRSAVTVRDSSGNDNTGEGTNTVLVSGKFNDALGFNGTNAYVLVPDSATVEQTSDFTVEAWVWVNPKTTYGNPGEYIIVAKANQQLDVAGDGSQAKLGYALGIDSSLGTLAGAISGNGSLTSASFVHGETIVSKGVWHHVALVYNHDDTPTLKVYLDGVLDGSVGSVAGQVSPAGGIPVTIGAWNNNSPANPTTNYSGFFHGKIDEVREWGRVLADNEILASAQSGLRGDWHFDTSVRGVTPDSSGYMNDATLAAASGPLPTIGGGGPEPWFGKSLQLTGSNYATVLDNSTLDNTAPFTLEGWIKPNALTGTQTIAGRWTGTVSTSAYVLGLQDDWLSASLAFGRDTLGIRAGAVTTGWQHVALVVTSGDEIFMYLNGVSLIGPVTISPAVNSAPGTNLTIGAFNNGSSYTDFFSGAIDEVHVWARALSPSEIGFLSGNCGGAVSAGSPTAPTGACDAELVVPNDMTQKIGSSDAEVFPETYFQCKATSGWWGSLVQGSIRCGSREEDTGSPDAYELPPEHAMPLWFMVSDPDTTGASPLNDCAIDLGSTPGDPKGLLGGLLGCQASTDGKSALLTGQQVRATHRPKTYSQTLHLDVTTSDGDELPVNVQWR